MNCISICCLNGVCKFYGNSKRKWEVWQKAKAVSSWDSIYMNRLVERVQTHGCFLHRCILFSKRSYIIYTLRNNILEELFLACKQNNSKMFCLWRFLQSVIKNIHSTNFINSWIWTYTNNHTFKSYVCVYIYRFFMLQEIIIESFFFY